ERDCEGARRHARESRERDNGRRQRVDRLLQHVGARYRGDHEGAVHHGVERRRPLSRGVRRVSTSAGLRRVRAPPRRLRPRAPRRHPRVRDPLDDQPAGSRLRHHGPRGHPSRRLCGSRHLRSRHHRRQGHLHRSVQPRCGCHARPRQRRARSCRWHLHGRAAWPCSQEMSPQTRGGHLTPWHSGAGGVWSDRSSGDHEIRSLKRENKRRTPGLLTSLTPVIHTPQSSKTSRAISPSRIYALNDAPIRPERKYIVYWMTSARRLHYNFALEHAVERARELGRPLILFEAPRCGYEHASDRLHAFVLQGMAEHAAALRASRARYYAYVEPEDGAGSGLLAALARDACVIVGDWSPAFFLPRMLAAAARQVDVRLEAVDSNGILPVADAGRAIPMAHGFRSHLQRSLRAELHAWPAANPLDDLPAARRSAIPCGGRERWPAADRATLAGRTLSSLPIDHGVAPVPVCGGTRAARERLAHFIDHGLARYGEDHNQPEQ